MRIISHAVSQTIPPDDSLPALTLERLAAEIRRQVADGYARLDMDQWMALSVWGRRQTERLFRERHFTSPARYFRDCQSDQARRLLQAGEDVLSAAAKAGFASPGRLHDAVVMRSGMTPGELRRQGQGVHIDAGFFQTQVGVVLLAATKRGLCAVRICGSAPSPEALAEALAALHTDYPSADIEENTEPLQACANQLVAFLDARAPTFCPALDILQGTAFQREVWAELQKIAPGQTTTYSELAQRVGRPGATRAVARACALNNLAIAIPCHRCIRSDGGLAGYRWGIEWKRRLLALEAEHRAQAQGS